MERLSVIFAALLLMSIVFGLIETLFAANPAQPRWRGRKGLKTDLVYWLLTPLLTKSLSNLGIVLILVGNLLGPKRPSAGKLSPYECGFPAFEDARMQFDVRYYLIAILFIVFDLEIAFLFPWAVALGSIGLFGLIAMGIFLAILVVGFIYEWKKGALEWE